MFKDFLSAIFGELVSLLVKIVIVGAIALVIGYFVMQGLALSGKGQANKEDLIQRENSVLQSSMGNATTQ